MRNLTILLFVITITSCSPLQFKYSTLNHAGQIDGIYNNKTVKIDTIENEFQLARKFRTDDRFRWDFAQYAMRQDMRWSYDFYWNNRMHRRGVGSPFNFYWNSQQYWWSWASNSPFNMGFNQWDPFGFNNYGWGSTYYGYNYGWNLYNNYGWGFNNWRSRDTWNTYAWNNRDDLRDVVRVRGRRGSNSVVNTNNDVSNTPNKRIVINNEDGIVIRNNNGEIIRINNGRNNNNIRVYNNPNRVPNNLRPNNNNRVINNNNVRGSWRPNNNNNNVNSRSSSSPRSYVPPPNGGNTSGGKVISRGSRGNNKQ